MPDTIRVFDTDRRIRLGVWGLGRGLHIAGPCAALNIDVVAGCDYNATMRTEFAERYPSAFVTDDAAAFLARDFDAVLLATYCPGHAADAIGCLAAGKHVLSEVTAFFTMAEGVRLVEAVEKSGLVYNMAENYPFTEANMWLARKWREGVFGELMYGEYEYVHETLTLSYTDINGNPLEPGSRAHTWRSWINMHYYNTHSLGPMMHITGTRPVQVVALPADHALPGYLARGGPRNGMVAPSLIRMSNGAVVRNLMGATTNDSHIQRLWGTNGSSELVDGRLRLRLGGRGNAPKLAVKPRWDDLGELAERAGHGGGDFWTLYHFARQILYGTPAPFDIYASADCTIPGILAWRSQAEGGRAYDVPDFRDPAQREGWRRDERMQATFDADRGLFGGASADPLACEFSRTMRDLVNATAAYRAFRDWSALIADAEDPAAILTLADRAIEAAPLLQEAQRAARRIVAAYPDTPATRVLREVLERSDEPLTSRPGIADALRAERDALARSVGGTATP